MPGCYSVKCCMQYSTRYAPPNRNKTACSPRMHTTAGHEDVLQQHTGALDVWCAPCYTMLLPKANSSIVGKNCRLKGAELLFSHFHWKACSKVEWGVCSLRNQPAAKTCCCLYQQSAQAQHLSLKQSVRLDDRRRRQAAAQRAACRLQPRNFRIRRARGACEAYGAAP